MVGDYDALEQVMADYGISRAFMFCLDEPDRHPGFTAANDRTLAFAERSNGRLIPFVRLDLNEAPIEQAVRCLDAGARGIKLHPRAQRFDSADDRLEPVFALAEERRVPILIHGGRGLPPIADGLAKLVDRSPDAALIIAHAGIADLAHLAAAMAGRKNVFFDTSTWSAIDLLDLYRRVPPEQVVYASDFPYGQQPGSLFIALRTAHRAGFSEEQLRGMLAGNANRLADGEALPEPTRPLGERLARPAAAARADPHVPLDGDALPLDAAGRHDRRARARPQRLLRAERRGRDDRPHRGAARDGLRALAVAAGSRRRPRARSSATRLCLRLIHIADVESLTGV